MLCDKGILNYEKVRDTYNESLNKQYRKNLQASKRNRNLYMTPRIGKKTENLRER